MKRQKKVKGKNNGYNKLIVIIFAKTSSPDTAERPNATIIPYILSVEAAANPVIRPERCPCIRLRLIQRMPIRPIGAAMEKPMIIPLRKKCM